MTTSTEDRRKLAAEWVEARKMRISNSQGFIVLRRYDTEEAYGIHEIVGLSVQKFNGEIQRVCLKDSTVGLVTPEIRDLFMTRVHNTHPEWLSVPWEHMSKSLQELITHAGVLPMEWKGEAVRGTDFLHQRVYYITSPALLRFLQS